MDHRTNGSMHWVAICILDNGYGRVFLVPVALFFAIWSAAVSHSPEKAGKQSTETTTESMHAFSDLGHERALISNNT
jgi:hypothetical protein